MSNKGIGAAKPRKSTNDSAKLEEVIDILKFSDFENEWVRVRLLERGLLAVKRHWCKIITQKTKQRIEIPKYCISFDPENEAEPKKGIECPYCELVTKDRATSPVTNEFFYLINAIVRDLQEQEPARVPEHTSKEKKSGYKDIKSKSWTPVRVLRLTNTVVARIQELGETNIVKSKKDPKKKQAFPLSHPKHGVDINIKYKPKASGSDKYSVDKSDEGRVPLTEEEMAYLVYNLDEGLLDITGRFTQEQAEDDVKKTDFVDSENIDDDNDDDEDGISLGKKKKKKKTDDDDDDVPRKKKKAKSKSRLDDEEEDDVPKKKKKKNALDDDDDAPKKKKKKPSSRDDDDDDEDDRPVKKKKKPSRSDDDDDAPKKKKKVKSKLDDDDDDAPVSKKKKKKPSRSDDDDEDDAPKKKKKKSSGDSDKKSSKKSGKKKSKIDDDDDDSW